MSSWRAREEQRREAVVPGSCRSSRNVIAGWYVVQLGSACQLVARSSTALLYDDRDQTALSTDIEMQVKLCIGVIDMTWVCHP